MTERKFMKPTLKTASTAGEVLGSKGARQL